MDDLKKCAGNVAVSTMGPMFVRNPDLTFEPPNICGVVQTPQAPCSGIDRGAGAVRGVCHTVITP